MPQAATLPTQAQRTQRRERGTVRHVPLEERVAVLETHAQQIATKADISDLRSEMIKWGVGAAIALFTAFAAMFIANTARIDRLDAKIDAQAARQDARMDRLDAKLDTILSELRKGPRGQ